MTKQRHCFVTQVGDAIEALADALDPKRKPPFKGDILDLLEWAERDALEMHQQVAERDKQIVMLRSLVPKRIQNGFVSFGKYYSEQEDKFNDPYNPMCKFKRKYLSDCEEALATIADLSGLILCEKEPKCWYDKHGMITHDPFEGLKPLFSAWEPSK